MALYVNAVDVVPLVAHPVMYYPLPETARGVEFVTSDGAVTLTVAPVKPGNLIGFNGSNNQGWVLN